MLLTTSFWIREKLLKIAVPVPPLELEWGALVADEQNMICELGPLTMGAISVLQKNISCLQENTDRKQKINFQMPEDVAGATMKHQLEELISMGKMIMCVLVFPVIMYAVVKLD